MLLINSFEEVNDDTLAFERYDKRLCAQERAEQIAYIKQLFIRAGTYMVFPFRPATYRHYLWPRIRTKGPNPEGSSFSPRSSVSVFRRCKGSGKYSKSE
jgi:hypothetical protein